MDFSRFLAFPLEQIPYVVVALAVAFSVHEFSHAYVAWKFGDPTAKNQGRLTLSPLAHLDILGTLFIFIAGFGWAKPVPVNRFFFKNPRLAGFLVSAAGPVSNLFVAALGMAVYYGLAGTGVLDNLSAQMNEVLYQFFNILIYLNVVLFVFNLLPFPPLDGYRMIEDLAPKDIRARMTQYEAYGIFLFLFLVITPLDQYTIQPIFRTFIPMVLDTMDVIFSPFIR
ncbi:site-2 protease family protein [Microaerobacter geothermalis]|uniref:site-2 protease family protein n=1 Tax=Microaerobacter geothermalis TaxID=674972 RepID=UPI001F24B64C|nr:site-2 protease family protein [Microaerobacter geothermalis]MCF6092489.1 site-2 protease family protein [Microaerobacter geothermalis]